MSLVNHPWRDALQVARMLLWPVELHLWGLLLGLSHWSVFTTPQESPGQMGVCARLRGLSAGSLVSIPTCPRIFIQPLGWHGLGGSFLCWFLRQHKAGSSLLEASSVYYPVLAFELTASLCSSRRVRPVRQPLLSDEDLPLSCGCTPQISSLLLGPKESDCQVT